MKDPSALDALERLLEGNRRFVANQSRLAAHMSHERRKGVITQQDPFAAVLGCSDSRVPVEVVFDQGFGDLFVVRTAGNVVTATEAGSVEFAVEQLGVGLIMVLGHTQCGAVQATLEHLRGQSAISSENLQTIIDHVRPAAVEVKGAVDEDAPSHLVNAVIRANVRLALKRLRDRSVLIARAARNGKLRLVGAVYSLDTGVVEFLDDPAT